MGHANNLTVKTLLMIRLVKDFLLKILNEQTSINLTRLKNDNGLRILGGQHLRPVPPSFLQLFCVVKFEKLIICTKLTIIASGHNQLMDYWLKAVNLIKFA